jgi:hypothetical protein
MDERIDVWWDGYKDLQGFWRRDHGGKNFGQVLIGNVRPSDQEDDGPQLTPGLRDYTEIDVYEAPDGFGWRATFYALEGVTSYLRTMTVHEDNDPVFTPWVVIPPSPFDAPAFTFMARARNLVVRSWRAIRRVVYRLTGI